MLVKILQGNYGHGWDDLLEFSSDETIKERKAMLRAYQTNELKANHRIITRRTGKEL